MGAAGPNPGHRGEGLGLPLPPSSGTALPQGQVVLASHPSSPHGEASEDDADGMLDDSDLELDGGMSHRRREVADLTHFIGH